MSDVKGLLRFGLDCDSRVFDRRLDSNLHTGDMAVPILKRKIA